MDDKKERFVRDLEDLAQAHRNTARALDNAAEGIRNGTLKMNELLNNLKDHNQRAYLEVSPKSP